MKATMASTDDNDESLMRLIKQGSHQAFAILVRRHTERFHAAAYRITNGAREAEDLVQDAFLKIWQRPDIWKEDAGAKFTTWFYRILINQNIDRIRRHKKLVDGNEILEFVADKAPNPEQRAAMTEEEEMIEHAIHSLPERQRDALNLCFYEGLSNAQAADAMGVKVKALESLLMRAKAGLKEFIGKNDNRLGKGKSYATR